jgi:retron-type reverse transcriptase
MRTWHNLFTKSITLEGVFGAWEEFTKGKRKKSDVQVFGRHLEDNLFDLYHDLQSKTYKHGGYQAFFVRDPKMRHIHKACVGDRVVHHLVSKELEKVFDPTFFTHSYSCRKNKGTHKGVSAFGNFARKASRNNTSPLFVLKCDIKKFFASVDHHTLENLVEKRVKDEDFMWLIREIIRSFSSKERKREPGFGIPIGNLTSQIFANIYLDPFDQFVKHELRVKYYIRYADDFVIISEDAKYLENLIPKLGRFLEQTLKMSLHSRKVSISNYYLGVDFLGYVVFPHFVLPRTKTKRRIFRKMREKDELVKLGKLTEDSLFQAAQSYLGYLSHANAFKLSQKIEKML